MTWKHEKQFADHRPGMAVTVGKDLDGDLGILCQDGRRTGQEFSIIVDGEDARALAKHILEIFPAMTEQTA